MWYCFLNVSIQNKMFRLPPKKVVEKINSLFYCADDVMVDDVGWGGIFMYYSKNQKQYLNIMAKYLNILL